MSDDHRYSDDRDGKRLRFKWSSGFNITADHAVRDHSVSWFSHISQLLTLLLLFASLGFYIFAIAAAHNTNAGRDKEANELYEADRLFNEIMKSNLAELSSKLLDAFPLTAQGTFSIERFQPNRFISSFSEIQALIADSQISLDEWMSDRQSPVRVGALDIDFSIVGQANAAQYKSRKKRASKQQVQSASLPEPPAVPAYSPAPPAHGLAKLPAMTPFVWFLLGVPGAIAACGFMCIRSKHTDVRGFGANVVTSVLGYYFGGGVSLLTVAFL